MFGISAGKANDSGAVLRALDKSLAIIEFDPKGTILTANQNFCGALGYSLPEIKGQHHRMFCEAEYTRSPDYVAFWEKLGRGEFDAQQYKRIGKGGREVWIQASYNPVTNAAGKVVKVVKVATDITKRVKSMEAIAAGLKELAENNLEVRLTQDMDSSFETLRGNFNESVARLGDTLLGVTNTAVTINGNLAEIAAASDDLSRRTEQQAAAVEQTSAAVKEISNTVKTSAERAKVATSAAANAKQEATDSGKVMDDAVSAMSNIEKSSKQITQIIGVIDEIAFQTNLLALNAGVEAARAGEAGRGFAVVAQEVRALAQRSAEAAKEIKTLIASSSDQVKHGVALVDKTGKALGQIVGKVAEIDRLVAEISATSEQQSTGLAEVATAVGQMDEMTQRNAAMVEQSTAAVQNLRQEAKAMAETVGAFRVGQQAAAPVLHKPAPAAPRAAPKAGANPVAQQRAKLVTALKAGGAQVKAEGWEEF